MVTQIVSAGASCSNAAISTKWFIHYKQVSVSSSTGFPLQAEFLLFYLVPCIVIIFVYSRGVLCLWMKNPQLEERKELGSERQCGSDSRRLKGSRKKNDSLRTRMSVVKMLVSVSCLCLEYVFR